MANLIDSPGRQDEPWKIFTYLERYSGQDRCCMLLIDNMGHIIVSQLHRQVRHRQNLFNQLKSGALVLLVCSDALTRGFCVSCLDGVIPSLNKTKGAIWLYFSKYIHSFDKPL